MQQTQQHLERAKEILAADVMVGGREAVLLLTAAVAAVVVVGPVLVLIALTVG